MRDTVVRGHLQFGKRVCMVSYSCYPSDIRVRHYAEALAERGDSVEVIAVRDKLEMPRDEVVNRVSVHRIQDRIGKDEQSKASFLLPLLRFLLASSGYLNQLQRSARFDLIHVHNIPDFMIFGAWHPKLRGARLILDIHDIVPEFFASKFAVTKRFPLVWSLEIMEKLSAAMVDHVILASDLWFDRYTRRSVSADKCSVFVNNVDSRLFHPRPRTRADGKLIVMFPGGLQWHQGLDIAIRAFSNLRVRLPQAEFHIYGDGNEKPRLMALTNELGLNGVVRFFDSTSIEEIAELMAQADLGVVPKRADSFGNEAYSTKTMQFMALGVPVVASSTKVDRYYFNDSILRFFESGNSAQLADAMFDVLTDQELRSRIVKSASDYVQRNDWAASKDSYLKLVDSLCRTESSRSSDPVRQSNAS